MDVISYAKAGLIATLEANLPAKLATLTPPTGIDFTDPAPTFRDRNLSPSLDRDILGPIVCIDRAQSRPGTIYTTGEWLIPLRVAVYFPGPVGAEAEVLDAAHAFAAAIHDVVKEGTSRGRWMVGTNYPQITVVRPVGVAVDQTVRPFTGERQVAVPVARAFAEFTLQVWQD